MIDDATAAMTRAGLNLIAQAISIFGSDLRLAVANQRMQEMFALPPELVTPGAEFEDVIRYLATRGEYGDVGDVEAFVRARVDLARTFEPHYMERTRANGRTISIEGNPLPGGGWITVYTDITGIKQQEELLRARSQELSGQLLDRAEELAAANRELAATVTALEAVRRKLTDSEARTRLTTEMVPAHIAHVDAAGIYTYSNRRLSAVLPGRPSDIVGRPIAQTLGPGPWAAVSGSLSRARAGEASVREFTDAPSGRRIRTAFTPDGTGTGGVYILSMDVTEETQARAALQQSRKRELAAQLTSGLAHDFSNLLTIILGMQSRLGAMDLPGEAPQLIAATIAAARRGGALLDRIAGISGGRELALRPVRLGLLLDELATLARPSLPEGMRLTLPGTLPEGPLMLDPGLLQDSLLNLVLNARDACAGQSGAEIAITLRTLQDTWLEIAVSDTGPGFSPEALAHGLDPFFTTKGGEGSGLGLSMVYDATKLAGGRLALHNRPDGGAEVTLHLPLRPAGEEAAPGLVLLVEDSADLRAGVRAMLLEAGHTVAEAASAGEALAMLSAMEGIACVVSDISLEGAQTGLDLAAALPPAMPAVLMTSLPEGHALHRRARALPGVPVLAKPFGATALASALAEAMAAAATPAQEAAP